MVVVRVVISGGELKVSVMVVVQSVISKRGFRVQLVAVGKLFISLRSPHRHRGTFPFHIYTVQFQPDFFFPLEQRRTRKYMMTVVQFSWNDREFYLLSD